MKSRADLHEVVCNVLWLQARDSFGGGCGYIDPEVSGLQSTEVCEQVGGLFVQGGGGTRQDLERKIQVFPLITESTAGRTGVQFPTFFFAVCLI